MATVGSGYVNAGLTERFAFAIIVLSLILLTLSPTALSYINHVFFIDKYAGTSLNTMSSGRGVYWSEALSVFEGSPAIGVGNYYVDNYYLNSLANVGIIGSVFIVGLLVMRSMKNLGMIGIISKEGIEPFIWIVFSLTFFYLIESIFEGLPPIGPGSCSFIFWMLSGYLDEIQLIPLICKKRKESMF
ncbi:MAG: O-antigen ligase family protein [Olegusella sp.]|nr:O-antigen ligase family protein [Olegusella sp.]